MAILSITFHTEEHKINDWNSFLEEELLEIIKNFSRKYIISEVESEMLSEGKTPMFYYSLIINQIEFIF